MRIYIHANFDPYENEVWIECFHVDVLLTILHLESNQSSYEEVASQDPTYFDLKARENRFDREKVDKLENEQVRLFVVRALNVPGVISLKLTEFSIFVSMGYAFDHEEVRKKLIEILLASFKVDANDLDLKIRYGDVKKYSKLNCRELSKDPFGFPKIAIYSPRRKKKKVTAKTT